MLVFARGICDPRGAMKPGVLQRAAFVLAFLILVAGLATGVWRYGYVQGLALLAQRGQADLALASDRLVGQLQRYRDLAVGMADHPLVAEALAGRMKLQTRQLLLEAADKHTSLDILVLNSKGQILAAAQNLINVDLAQQPFVKRALRGALGWGHTHALPATDRAFYYAAPVFDVDGSVQGAVLVVTDLNRVDNNWRGSNTATFFTDDKGLVYISNRSELLFWRRPLGAAGLIPPNAPAPPFSSDYVGSHEIWNLGWGRYLPREALHLTQELPVIGMSGEVLVDVAQTRALARAQMVAFVGLCLAFGSLLFMAAERRRALSTANAKLEARVRARTQLLREVNTQLRVEAEVREEAQTALRRAQDELVQAGKLSALGQMSAGISHELNQPLMAIRSFADNATQFMARGKPERAEENLGRISEMSQRMGRIIQNLRAFARQEDTAQDRVDLCRALRAAVDLTRSHVEDAGVALDLTLPDAPLWVRGGEVRLGQVFVNLITNAVDAMAGSAVRRLTVHVREGDALTVDFQDTGPGIEMPDKVFDPFYTTKEVGETGGMGLGLSISYGIVQSFGGDIRGSNIEGGGALFSVVLERAEGRDG